MKSSREQFEEWFPQMVEGLPETMARIFEDMLFTAWQASLAAIEIELPDWVSFGARAAIDYDDTVSSLRSHGLKVKVEE